MPARVAEACMGGRNAKRGLSHTVLGPPLSASSLTQASASERVLLTLPPMQAGSSCLSGP